MDAGFKISQEVMDEFTNNLKFKPKYRALILGVDPVQGDVFKVSTLPRDFNYPDLYAEGSEYLPQKDVRY